MLRIINQDPNTFYDTHELVQEFQFQQASLVVENEKMLAWRTESASRHRFIDEALSRLKNRLDVSDEDVVSLPFLRKAK